MTTTPRDLAVIGLGELLWDELPEGRQLGGAPANFAVMAARLGVHGIVASRVGEDALGRAAREVLSRTPVDVRYVQTDAERATGTVTVALEGEHAAYTIHAPAAWDSLELTAEWQQLAARADAVCWGTLAQRDSRSEQTVLAFLTHTRPSCLRIFDVNLRAPFFTAEAVSGSLRHATLLKLNESEMPHLLSLANLAQATAYAFENDGEREAALAADARHLLDAYPLLDTVAVTLGAHGSLLITREAALRHRGIQIESADPVGAGDAFTAALCVHRLLGFPLKVQSEAANRWGAWVASQRGAMPELSGESRATLEAQIRAAAAA